MSTFDDTTTAASTQAAGIQAVGLALLVTIASSCVFFYLMRWAASASSSERRRKPSRHPRGNVSDGFTTAAKQKKSASTVHQRKRNSKNNAVVRPVLTNATNMCNANGVVSNSSGANGKDGNKKKKAVDYGDVFSTNTVSTGDRRNNKPNEKPTVHVSGSDTTVEHLSGVGSEQNRRTRRQRQRGKQSRSGGENSANSRDHNSETVMTTSQSTTDNSGQRRSSSSWSSHSHVDEDHIVTEDFTALTNDLLAIDDGEGEWITMVTMYIIRNQIDLSTIICVLNNLVRLNRHMTEAITKIVYVTIIIKYTTYSHWYKYILHDGIICVFQGCKQ